MKLRFKFIILSISFIFFVILYRNFAVHTREASDKTIPNIIVITLSGVRNIDSINDPTHQYIPNLWNKMLKEYKIFLY